MYVSLNPRCEPWRWYIDLQNRVIFRYFVRANVRIQVPWFAHGKDVALAYAGVFSGIIVTTCILPSGFIKHGMLENPLSMNGGF